LLGLILQPPGQNLVDAQTSFDSQTNEPVVTFRFDSAGAKVGTPWPAVRAFLGQPDETLPGETQGESRYWYKQRGIAFILKDRTVTAIVVLAAVNEPASRGFLDDLLGIGRGRWEGKK